MMADGLPHWLVIGAMKAGTTTMHRWLQSLPECFAPADKELNFFSKDELWSRGVDWYRAFYEAAPSGALKGESSPAYTRPSTSEMASQRIRELAPDVRLIYLVRDPFERARSQFEHNVRKGREDRTLAEAMTDDDPYISRSLYHACLSPYIERFPAEQICVVALERLRTEPEDEWGRVVRHLGLPHRPPPSSAHNVTATKHRPTAAFRWLTDPKRGAVMRRLPDPVRRAGRRLVTRPLVDRPTGAQVRASLSPAALERVRVDTERLCTFLGVATPPWGAPTPVDELSRP